MRPPDECIHCGRTFGPKLVLIGWHPCKCGGHMYAYCRKETGGCGRTTYDPPMRDDTCEQVRFGYEGTS